MWIKQTTPIVIETKDLQKQNCSGIAHFKIHFKSYVILHGKNVICKHLCITNNNQLHYDLNASEQNKQHKEVGKIQWCML